MINADMHVEVRQFCELNDKGQQLIKAAMTQLQISARAYRRIPSTSSGQSLKLARTIADLTGEESIQSSHLAESVHASQ